MAELKKLKRAVIKEELVAITGDYLEAIILNQMLYWSERVSDFDKFVQEENERQLKYCRPSQGEIPQEQPLLHGWIYKKASELKDEIMSTTSEDTINRKLTSLVKKGFLDRRNNPKIKYDRTYHYRINFSNIIMALTPLGYTLEGYKMDLSIYAEPLKSLNPQFADSKEQIADLKKQIAFLKEQNAFLKEQFAGAIPETTIDTTIESTGREETPPPPKPILSILKQFKEGMSDVGFNTWIKPTVGKAYIENDTIVIPCPNDFTLGILNARYIDTIKSISEYPIKLIEVR